MASGAKGSGFLYLAAFLYEKGYCDHFGIPLSLIVPSLTSILRAAVAIGSALLVALILASWSMPIVKSFAQSDGRRSFVVLAAINAAALLASFVGIVLYGFRPLVMWSALFFFAGGNFSVIWPAFRLRVQYPTWAERFRAANSLAEKNPGVFDKLGKFTGPGAFFASAFFYVVLVLAYIAGNGNAATQREFLVLSDQPQSLVLRIYGDTIITAKVDEQSHETGDDFMLLHLPSNDKLSLSSKKNWAAEAFKDVMLSAISNC